MNKYGIDNFSFEIIEECEGDELSDREKYWINYYSSTYPNGYNLTKGGDGGNTFKYRTKEQMEVTKRKIKEATSGVNNGFYGKHHSNKTKEYLRKINLGKMVSEKTRMKLSNSLKGHNMPHSAKQKISNATKKQWENEDFRVLMNNVNKGNKYTQGNEWNKNRVDIFHPDTLEHKRIFSHELVEYINMGYIEGIPSNDKRYHPKIRRCTKEDLIGVRFDKQYNKWQSYINYQNKRYGVKFFDDMQSAIKHRNTLEDVFINILENNINLSKVNIRESLKRGEVVLWTD